MKLQTVEIAEEQYSLLCDVARKIGVSVEKLIQQELNEAINNACCWVERAQL